MTEQRQKYMKAYYQKNKERILEYKKKYYQENKFKNYDPDYQKQYYEEHKEELKDLPGNTSRVKRSSMPQPKTRPDSPVPSLQGPCDRSLKSEEP